MPYQRQILLSRDRVPRRSVAILSVCVHLAVLLVIFALRHATRAHVVPEKYETAQILSGSKHVSFSPPGAKAGQPHASPLHLPRRTRTARAAAAPIGTEGEALQVLREHAKRATTGMMDSIKVRQFYGFSTEHYDYAAQTAGQLPTISAAELPPRYEQYVIVEVTIDVDGRVADARIVSGDVSKAIQQKLLAAIRDFKYSPARRDGTPIPTQLDIVVHVPS